MARTLDQIIKEIDPGYAGSRKTAQSQIAALPGETEAQLSGLQATAERSHEDILAGARRRNLGFSGIPIGEQVEYDATTFKPAVANLYSTQNARKSSLEEALNSLYRDQRNQATTLRESEIGREEQQRQFNANLAFQREQLAEQKRQANAANSLGGGYFGGGGGGDTAPAAPKVPSIKQRADKGFNFTDSTGRAISAAAYSKLAGVPFRTLLQQMANKGDRGAAQALQFVGNDYGYNAPKIGNDRNVINLLNNLLWGVSTVKTPASSYANYSKARAGLGL